MTTGQRVALSAILAIVAAAAGVGTLLYMDAEDRAQRQLVDEMDEQAVRQIEQAEAR